MPTKRIAESSPQWNPVPEDIRDCYLMVVAWRDCLMWAIGFEPILSQYATETGKKMDIAGRTGIVAMVDEATGCRAAEVRRFIEWFNANVWGPAESGDDM